MPGRFFAIDPAVRFPVMFPDCVFLVRLSLRPSVYPCVLVPVYLCARPRILPSLFRLILALILVPLRPCPPFISAIRPSLRARNPSGYFSRKMLRCASSGLRRSSSRNSASSSTSAAMSSYWYCSLNSSKRIIDNSVCSISLMLFTISSRPIDCLVERT